MPTITDIIYAALESCEAFADVSNNFFNFEKRKNAWRGWENWLTVDIIRKLNNKTVIPFAKYPKHNYSMDFGIGEKPDIYKIVVEIKTTYFTEDELERRKSYLVARLRKDMFKFEDAEDAWCLYLIAIVLPSHNSCVLYEKQVDNYLKNNRNELAWDDNFRWRFYGPVGGGDRDYVLLLAITDMTRLPK